MKLKDIENALGAGTIFEEADCSLIESKYLSKPREGQNFMRVPKNSILNKKVILI